jgi:hypothetical protein
VDIHDIARGPWFSTTRAASTGPSVAAMTALDVTTPQQRSWDRPQPILWLHTIIRRSRLDRMLADGHDPAADALLSMRARQHVQPAARARLAAALQDAVQSVEGPRLARQRSPQVPVAADCVRECSYELRSLAHSLTDVRPHARGVVMARDLLTDGTGPLYTSGMAGELHSRIRAARCAL